jgi:hypothetical protein
VSGDYLWDGNGEPDPEIVRLEQALRTLRSARPAPGWAPEPRPEVSARWPVSSRPALAAAAAVLLALAAALTRAPGPADRTRGWGVAWLEGASWSQSRVVREGRLAVGEWIETRDGRARLSVGRIGQLQLEPATRVGLLDAGSRAHRLSLERGTVHAMIWAPPGRFLVDTPSATAVDLGCSYTLEVQADGSGRLRVDTGWVGLEYRGRDSLVPAGAACATRPGRGPGTPFYETAPPALREALGVIDSGAIGDERRAAVDRALAAARPRDALSLWHLLSRVEGGDRDRVYDRLASLVPPPWGVTREGIGRGDRAMRDAWWDELGLGSADFWRDWTRTWSDPAGAGR